VVALSARGTMHCPRNFVYVNKIATGPEARDVIDINAPVAENLRNIARAKNKEISQVTVVVLDRPRHEQLLEEIRRTGARVKLISDGDVSAAIDAALPERDVDVLMGVGGTPEGVLSAAAIRCVGGAIQCKAWPRNEKEKEAAIARGEDIGRVYRTEDMVGGDDVFFAATGVSTGDLFKGVRYFSGGAQTQSLVMRCRSGTVRWVDARHNFDRLDKLDFVKVH
jgi:fructose-1,6-bisphosphatase II